MTVQIATGAEVRREVAQLLLQHLTPAKLARFWADWQVGQGEYIDGNDQVLSGALAAHLLQISPGDKLALKGREVTEIGRASCRERV